MFRTWSFRSRVPWCCFPPLIISQHNLCDILCKTTCTNTSVLSILRNCWSSGVYKDRFIKWYVHLSSIELRKLSLHYVTSRLPFGNQSSHPWYHSRIAFNRGPSSFSRLIRFFCSIYGSCIPRKRYRFRRLPKRLPDVSAIHLLGERGSHGRDAVNEEKKRRREKKNQSWWSKSNHGHWLGQRLHLIMLSIV